jgi:hypothetical protein
MPYLLVQGMPLAFLKKNVLALTVSKFVIPLNVSISTKKLANQRELIFLQNASSRLNVKPVQ